jgi:hypothetical protein
MAGTGIYFGWIGMYCNEIKIVNLNIDSFRR